MKALNAGQALAMVLVDELVRCGLTHACVAPGSRSTPLALALAEHPGVETHVVIDERSAAFCALGMAKATGLPAAVLCTSGTAAANFHPAVIEADRSRTPLLVLTADRPPELRHAGANQTIDQIKLYGDAVRWFVEVGVPEALPGSVPYWRSTACRAWAEAVGTPGGPVHLNLAFRDPLVPIADERGFPHPLDGRPAGEPWTPTTRAPGALDPRQLERLAGHIAGTARGLVVAGECSSAVPAALDLARATGWPVLADPLSGLRQGDAAVSTYEALLRHQGFAAAMRPDTVLRIGGVGTSKTLAGFLGADIRQIVVDPDGTWIDPERAATWLIRADPGALAHGLAGLVPPRDPAWLASWRRAERAARSALDVVLDREEAPSEPRTARDLAAACPPGANLVAASSMPIRDLEWFMAPRPGLNVIANRGASGIDGFVSTALGAALATGVPTVALAGDLSMLHDQNGLLLARSGVDAVFVVINNDGGGIFSFLPQAEVTEHFEKLWGTPHGVSFEAVAALYGCGYRRIERAAELVPALETALDAGGVRLIEVPTDRAANVVLHRRLWKAVEEALEELSA